MSEEADQIETALIEREESDYGGTFTYAGQDYPCSIGAQRNEALLAAGGFGLQKTRVVVVRKSAIADPSFHAGQFCTVTDKQNTAYSLKIAPEGINDGTWFWELTLHDRTQGAR